MTDRPEDSNLQVGVGDEPGFMNFYLIDKYSGRNSFSKHSAVNSSGPIPSSRSPRSSKFPSSRYGTS